MKNLLIIGGGFAGLWSAVSAVRRSRELGKADELQIRLISKDGFHTNRPRLYQSDLDGMRKPLRKYCDPLGIELIVGEVVEIQPNTKKVTLMGDLGEVTYDSLILAAGSSLARPEIPGVENTFDIDSFSGAASLTAHLDELAKAASGSEAISNIVVVGGSFTGLELATFLHGYRGTQDQAAEGFKVHIVEKSPAIAMNYAKEGQQYINERLEELGITVHLAEEVVDVKDGSVVLSCGDTLLTQTVVYTTGPKASSLTEFFDGDKDELGRLVTGPYLELDSHGGIYTAGDTAKARVDDNHYAVMSCQHAMPQGKFAGHNAVSGLFGEQRKTYQQPDYVTCLDLGADVALLTNGWERNVDKTGAEAKGLKTWLVNELIVPPDDMEEMLKQSEPEQQSQ